MPCIWSGILRKVGDIHGTNMSLLRGKGKQISTRVELGSVEQSLFDNHCAPFKFLS